MGYKGCKTAALLIAVLMFQVLISFADDWPTPQPQHVVSTNGKYLVRIVPGESWGDTVGFAGSKKGAYAQGEFLEKQADRSYRLISEVALQNPIAPVYALLSNQGYLVTFDNWHNAGYGAVVVIYKPEGTVLQSYKLEALYTAKRIEEISHSVSSRHWLSENFGFVPGANDSKVYAYDFRSGLFLFDLIAGNYEYLEGGQSSSWREHDHNRAFRSLTKVGRTPLPAIRS